MYEEREVCFAPVFVPRGILKCFLLIIIVVPAMFSILIPLWVVVVLFTLGRGRPRREVTCAIKRLWYRARHCGGGNDDSGLVL